MNKRIGHRGLYTLVALSLLSILVMTGCNFSNSGFKSVTIENELCHYSLEYPAYYDKDIRDNFDFDVPYTALTLDAPTISEVIEVPDPSSGEIKTVTGYTSPAVIYVIVSDSKEYWGESYSATDKLEGVLEDEAKWENFELLERASMTVFGIEGEMVAYLVDKLMPIPREDGQRLEYNRAVYFEYDGLIWLIEAKCNQEIMDQVRADFEHIVETFTILD
jgi:hypothetical protein